MGQQIAAVSALHWHYAEAVQLYMSVMDRRQRGLLVAVFLRAAFVMREVANIGYAIAGRRTLHQRALCARN